MSEMKNTLYGIKGRLLRKDVTWRHSKRNDPKWNTEKELKKNNRASVKHGITTSGQLYILESPEGVEAKHIWRING